jgi:hypothetical protein
MRGGRFQLVFVNKIDSTISVAGVVSISKATVGITCGGTAYLFYTNGY